MAWSKEENYACTIRDGSLILALKDAAGKVWEKCLDFEAVFEWITDQAAGLVRISAKYPCKCREGTGKIRFQEVSYYDPAGLRGKKMVCFNCMEGLAS